MSNLSSIRMLTIPEICINGEKERPEGKGKRSYASRCYSAYVRNEDSEEKEKEKEKEMVSDEGTKPFPQETETSPPKGAKDKAKAKLFHHPLPPLPTGDIENSNEQQMREQPRRVKQLNIRRPLPALPITTTTAAEHTSYTVNRKKVAINVDDDGDIEMSFIPRCENHYRPPRL